MYIQTNDMNIQKKDGQLSLRINKEQREQFKEFCEKKGFTYSKRIVALMMKDIETNGDIL